MGGGGAAPPPPPERFIKVCGVTNPEDAELAASAGGALGKGGRNLYPRRSAAVPASRQRKTQGISVQCTSLRTFSQAPTSLA